VCIDAASQRRQDAGQAADGMPIVSGEHFAIYVTQEKPHAGRSHALVGMQLARASRRTSGPRRRDPVNDLEYGAESRHHPIFVGHNLRRTWRARISGTPLRSADSLTPRASTSGCSRNDLDQFDTGSAQGVPGLRRRVGRLQILTEKHKLKRQGVA